MLEDVLEVYMYHCIAKGFIAKTIKNKRQEYKQLNEYLITKRGISQLESISTYDLKSYILLQQIAGVLSQNIVSIFKMIKAFFRWCEKRRI